MVKKEKNTSRKEKALKTKQNIYLCAEQLFKEHGFYKVSVDAIVEKAGVSKGAFYVHFASKNALIVNLAADYVKHLDLDYKHFFASFSAGAGTSEIIISLAEKIADLIVHDVGYELIKVLYEVQITRTLNADAVMGYQRELYKLFGRMLNRGIEREEFRADLDVETTAKHFIMASRGLIYEWCIRYPDFDLKEASEKHYALLLTGIKK